MKRAIVVTLIGVLLVTSAVSPAQAGGGRGQAIVVLGLGLLTGAILGVAAARPAPVVAAPAVPAAVVVYPPPQWMPGRWQTQWAPSVTQLQVRAPGHHDAYGHWTAGHCQTQVIQGGAWTQVWVPGHWE
jgi:hypothetical protein